MQEALTMRRARPGDEAQVLALLAANKGLEVAFDPTDFCVATSGNRIVACGRVKRHADGSLELASVATSKELRGQGIGGRLVDALVAPHKEPVYALALAPDFFAAHGFRLIDKATLPNDVRAKADGMCSSQPFKAMVLRAH